MTATHGLGTYGNGVGTVTPLDHKLAQSALIAKQSGITVRPGVFWGGVKNLVTGRSDMAYDVAAFTAALSRGPGSGTVLLANDGVLTVATTAAPGSNSRYDVVYVWQREYAIDGTDSNPVIGVLQGTPAASPAVPTLVTLPGAIELARILVPAGVTATNTGTTITQRYPVTTADGGMLRVPDAVTRDRSLSPVQGDLCCRIDTGCIEEYFQAYNASTNPGGALVAGWYPVHGMMPKLEVSATGSFSMTATKSVIDSWGTTVYQRTLPSLSSGVFTADLAGRYSIEGYVDFIPGASGIAGYLAIMKNSTIVAANTDGSSSSLGNLLSVETKVNLAVGDTVSLFAARTAGNATDRRFVINYLGPA